MSNIKLMENRFNQYLNDYKNCWLDRFTWKGIFGDTPKHSISIVNFAKQTTFLDNIPIVSNVINFHKKINNLSDQYIKWVISIDNSYTQEELEDIKNFFLGAIGEYFFVFLLTENKRILIKTATNSKLQNYDFNYIAPRLKGEYDVGVDLTGVISYGQELHNCALQVKFWNPFIDTPITNKIIQGIHSDAICNNFIDNNENNNIIVCWLGNTQNVSKYLIANKLLYKHIIFIDNNALDNSINYQNKLFWMKLNDALKDIKTFK